jgi:hypothetical protein
MLRIRFERLELLQLYYLRLSYGDKPVEVLD